MAWESSYKIADPGLKCFLSNTTFKIDNLIDEEWVKRFHEDVG